MATEPTPPESTPTEPANDQESRSTRHTIALSSTAVFLIALEITIISVALPEIEAAFAGTPRTTISWVFTAYNIGVASFLLLAGWMAELVGRKRVFLIGMAVFVVGSIGAGLAPSIGVLIAARAVQSIGGAMIIPASLALLMQAVEPSRRDAAIGVWGAMAGLAAAVGPTLGAFLVDTLGWRWVFLINVPIALVAIVAGFVHLRESRDANKSRRVDPLAIPAGAAGVGVLVFAIVAGGSLGWTDGRVVLSLAISVVLVLWFVRRSVSHAHPLFDPVLARRRSFAVGAIGTLLFGAAFSGWLVLVPTFLGEVWGYSVLKAGLAIAPGPLAMAIVAGPAGKATARLGHRTVITIGALLPVVGVASWITLVNESSSYVTSFLPGLILFGLGIGVGFPMLTAAALRDVPPNQFAIGAAGNTTLRQIAMAIGISLAFAIVGSGDELNATLGRFQISWGVCAALFVATSAVVWLRYPKEAI